MRSHASRTKKVVSSCMCSLHQVQRAHARGYYFFRSRSRDRGSWCWCVPHHYVCRRAIAPASSGELVCRACMGLAYACSSHANTMQILYLHHANTMQARCICTCITLKSLHELFASCLHMQVQVLAYARAYARAEITATRCVARSKNMSSSK